MSISMRAGVVGRRILVLAAVSGFALAGCATDSSGKVGPAPAVEKVVTGGVAPTGQPGKIPASAIAAIDPRSGSQVTGTVQFFSLPSDRVRVVVDLTGLTPGLHGLHIHENGDCSAPDASSAGGHWNPTHVKHGNPRNELEHHVGDFGNITADAGGNAKATFETSDIQISGPLSIMGRSVVVHGGEDDLASQPAGNSGPRVGCGVIGYQPEK